MSWEPLVTLSATTAFAGGVIGLFFALIRNSFESLSRNVAAALGSRGKGTGGRSSVTEVVIEQRSSAGRTTKVVFRPGDEESVIAFLKSFEVSALQPSHE